MNKLSLSHIALFIVALIYGANYSIAKILMDPGWIQPNAFILLRVLSATFLFWLFAKSHKQIEPADYNSFIICAICGVAGNQLLFFNGLKMTSPLHAALIMVCTPILVLLIKSIKGDQLTKLQWAGCIIGLFGAIFLILSGSQTSVKNASLAGDIMVLLNAILYSIYLLKVPALIEKYNAFSVMKWIFLIALVPVLIFGALELPQIHFNSFELPEWSAFLFVLIATTFVAYALNAYALENSNAELVSHYIYLQPLLATFIAIGLKKDVITFNHVSSGLLIFIGLYMSSQNKN
ncbi:MAG: DMT family transporter [Saprospiraceae bacterium]|nr:DMT family transporter [Saprospiraceae bacterium]